MNQMDLEKTSQHFCLGIFQSAQPVFGGLIHKMWQVKTDRGIFALKELSQAIKFDEKTKNSYEESEAIARSFSKAGIPAVSALSRNGRSLYEIDGRFFLCYPWLHGKTLARNEITDLHRVKMAGILADIHRVSYRTFSEKQIEYAQSFDLDELFKEVLSTGPSYKALLMKYADLLLNVASLHAEAILAMPKKGLISHTDLDPKNVMWDEQQNPHLIDWEGAQAINPTQDIVQLAIDWSWSGERSIDWEALKTIIRAFRDNGGVIDQSLVRNVLILILGNSLNWLAFNLKRSIDPCSSERDLSIAQVSESIEGLTYLYRSIIQIEKMSARVLI